MKNPVKQTLVNQLILATVTCLLGLAPSARAGEGHAHGLVLRSTSVASSDNNGPSNQEQKVVIEDLEPSASEGGRREVAWLGLATEESSEAVTSQLGLKTGEGLIVMFVAPDSPAGKAGFQKNDLLLELDGQVLVHPAQFRKLVQMHKEGDSLKLTFYRAGKKEETSVKLGKTTLGGNLMRDEHTWQGDFRDLQRQLSELPIREKMHEEMQKLRENLAQAGIDKETIRVEVKKSMEEARRALQEALRQATNAHRTFGPAMREMQELVRRGVDVDKDATVIVKSHRNDVKSIVKTDDMGTYVLVANPKKHLTAHDKSGKMTFDGEIETAEQQEKVPKDIWKKVEPMLDQLNNDKPEQPEADEKAGA